MNELIKITETNGRKAVSARELHYFLESKQEFATWIKNRVKKYDLTENEDYVVFDNSVNNLTGGRPTIEYALTLDAAKELSMVEGNAKGKQARKYFIECEKELREQTSKPMSMLDMMEANIALHRENEKRMDKIETKVLEIEAKTATRPEYFTIIGYAIFNGIQIGLTMAAQYGQKAARICKAKGYAMDTVPDPRFGRVRSYPKMVLQQVFDEPVTAN